MYRPLCTLPQILLPAAWSLAGHWEMMSEHFRKSFSLAVAFNLDVGPVKSKLILIQCKRSCFLLLASCRTGLMVNAEITIVTNCSRHFSPCDYKLCFLCRLKIPTQANMTLNFGFSLLMLVYCSVQNSDQRINHNLNWEQPVCMRIDNELTTQK